MTARRAIIAISAAILLAGLIGLLVPVSVSDSSGGSIRCGNAAMGDLSAARSANDRTLANIPVLNQFIPHNDYVGECQSSLSSRRGWAIPVAIIGLIGIGGALVARTREKVPEGLAGLDQGWQGWIARKPRYRRTADR